MTLMGWHNFIQDCEWGIRRRSEHWSSVHFGMDFLELAYIDDIVMDEWLCYLMKCTTVIRPYVLSIWQCWCFDILVLIEIMIIIHGYCTTQLKNQFSFWSRRVSMPAIFMACLSGLNTSDGMEDCCRSWDSVAMHGNGQQTWIHWKANCMYRMESWVTRKYQFMAISSTN